MIIWSPSIYYIDKIPEIHFRYPQLDTVHVYAQGENRNHNKMQQNK